MRVRAIKIKLNGRHLRWCLRGIALAVVLLLAGVTGLMISIIRYAGERDDGPADAAIVLGAAVWNGNPSPVFAERIRHAIDLKKSEQVRFLIFTGGLGEGDTIAESEAACAVALAQGIAPDNLLIETRSRATLENLIEAREIIHQHGFRRVLIVSDPLHMRRAMTMARDLGLEARPSPTPTTRYRSLWSKIAFLIRETYYYGKYLITAPRRLAVLPHPNPFSFPAPGLPGRPRWSAG